MPRTLQFVDALSADAEVLLDLDASPFRMSSWSPGLPSKRTSWASSNMMDGAVATTDAWENRELKVVVTLAEEGEQSAAEAWQSLARVLTGPRWLRYTPDDGAPMFFRTFACSPDEFREWMLHPGVKQAEITIPADPFAYGLPESGSATVENDPTVANGMRFTVSGVKGDVPAPLRLDLDEGDDPARWMVSSSTSQPIQFPIALVGPSVAGWTIDSTFTDSSAVGGKCIRLTRSVGTAADWIAVAFTSDLLPGDWRVLVRVRTSTSATVRMVADVFGEPMGAATVTVSGVGWRWIDLGVARAPRRSRRGHELEPATPGTAYIFLAIQAQAPSSAQTVDVDHVMLVPAPGADGAVGDLGIYSRPTLIDEIGAPVVVSDPTISGQSSDAWSGIGRQWGIAGGFPKVVPGVATAVTLAPIASASGNDIDASSTVDWSYHPRYLYLRGD